MKDNLSRVVSEQGKEYSQYVLYHRAIPSLVDGLKPVHRKILYIADKYAKNSLIKTASLAGQVIAYANYHHGDASVAAAISGMCQQFAGSNNVALLQGEGAHGTRLIPSPASPRYTFAGISDNFYNVYKDTEVAPPSDDPENPEPQFYLPLIPMVLVNGSRGIAVGFSCTIYQHNPLAITQACIDYLNFGTVAEKLKPDFVDVDSSLVYDCGNNTFEMDGRLLVVDEGYIVTELPVDMTREKFVKHLLSLQERGKIDDYTEHYDGDEVAIVIECEHVSDPLILLNLRKKLHQNITVVDDNNNLRIFESAEELVAAFCDIRLAFYSKKIQYDIEQLQIEIEQLRARLHLIEFVRDFDDIKTIRREDLKNSVQSFSDHARDFALRTPLTSMSAEDVALCETRIYSCENHIDELREVDPKEMYLADLHELHNHFERLGY